ncbi:MAG TPA: LytR C-terminal domain-containing protein [Gemmatimonadaceae bacterium]|nr:LytR C-terminal domain-containing protein [Gemmatimonadaceae bacterium]
MKRGPLIVGLAAALLMAGGAWYWWARAHATLATTEPPDLTAPARERVRVEVINSTTRRGLARRATFALRAKGFDVVLIGTSSDRRDSTLVLDRSNHPDWARRVAAALGGARVQTRPDSTVYVDVTVLLGRTWRPPAEPLRP